MYSVVATLYCVVSHIFCPFLLIFRLGCFFLCISFSDDESMEDDTSVKILDTAKESLLQGLSEENEGLQSVLTNKYDFSVKLKLCFSKIFFFFFLFCFVKALRSQLLE